MIIPVLFLNRLNKPMLMKAHKFALLAGLVLLASCGGGKKETDRNKTATTDTPVTDTVLSSQFYKRLEGTVAGKAVVMHLQRNGNIYDGMYYYLDQGKWILLTYIKDSSSNTDLYFTETVAISTNSAQETNPPQILLHFTNGAFTGNWKNKEGKTYPIDLREVYPAGSFRFSTQSFLDTAAAFPDKVNTPVARISESFPVAAGASDTAGWINNRMMKMLDFDTAANATFEQSAAKAHAAYLRAYKDESKKMTGEEASAFLNYELGHSVAIRYNKNGLLIFESLYYAYEGGAHGNYSTTMLCYDADSKREIQLKDILNADSAVLQPILEKNLRLQMSLKPGVALSSVLFEEHLALTGNFYFTEKGIGFVYNPYEIASYAQGTINIFVPFTDLQPYLNMDLVKRIR
jgi:hypothetical protein